MLILIILLIHLRIDSMVLLHIDSPSGMSSSMGLIFWALIDMCRSPMTLLSTNQMQLYITHTVGVLGFSLVTHRGTTQPHRYRQGLRCMWYRGYGCIGSCNHWGRLPIGWDQTKHLDEARHGVTGDDAVLMMTSWVRHHHHHHVIPCSPRGCSSAPPSRRTRRPCQRGGTAAGPGSWCRRRSPAWRTPGRSGAEEDGCCWAPDCHKTHAKKFTFG